jgi:hypothetical protein
VALLELASPLTRDLFWKVTEFIVPVWLIALRVPVVVQIDRHRLVAGIQESGCAVPPFVPNNFTSMVYVKKRGDLNLLVPRVVIVCVQALRSTLDLTHVLVIVGGQLKELTRVHVDERVHLVGNSTLALLGVVQQALA